MRMYITVCMQVYEALGACHCLLCVPHMWFRLSSMEQHRGHPACLVKVSPSCLFFSIQLEQDWSIMKDSGYNWFLFSIWHHQASLFKKKKSIKSQAFSQSWLFPSLYWVFTVTTLETLCLNYSFCIPWDLLGRPQNLPLHCPAHELVDHAVALCSVIQFLGTWLNWSFIISLLFSPYVPVYCVHNIGNKCWFVWHSLN